VSQRALSDVKILDLTHYIAGPYCTKLLADHGADVVKVEKPGQGDGARRVGPFLSDDPDPEKSGLFLYLNTNKKSITLNLKADTGVKVFKELVREADILVESFRPGVMARLGLDYETLEKMNPRLVMTSISNFGQSGPYRDYKSAHLVESALAGWLYVVGEPNREPVQTGGWLSQYVAGLVAATGTMTALYYQRQTDVGQHVDVSMMEAAIPIATVITTMYSYLGRNRQRVGNVFFLAAGFVVPCKDGYVGVQAYTMAQFDLLCQFIGMPELAADPKLKTVTGLRDQAREVSERIAPWFRDKKQDEVFHAAQEWGIPFGLIPTAEDLVNSPHLKARGWFAEADHPQTGRVTYPGRPFQLSETPWAIRRTAPLLGEHNEEVYGRLGYTGDDLVRMRERGVI
jgi:crotonobetainyl-CoA:carnitine CoA-transferase CaiB-like acyl-CoA transferase